MILIYGDIIMIKTKFCQTSLQVLNAQQTLPQQKPLLEAALTCALRKSATIGKRKGDYMHTKFSKEPRGYLPRHIIMICCFMFYGFSLPI